MRQLVCSSDNKILICADNEVLTMLQRSMKHGVNHVASGIERRRPTANEPYTHTRHDKRSSFGSHTVANTRNKFIWLVY